MYRMIVALTLWALSTAATAESFTCGQRVITDDATVAELRQKCGEPTSKDIKTEDVYGRSAASGASLKRGTTTTERWIYNRGQGQFQMVVIIVDGKVRSIERASK